MHLLCTLWGTEAAVRCAGSLGWQAYVRFVVWLLLSLLVYLLYSIHQPRAGSSAAGCACVPAAAKLPAALHVAAHKL